MTELLRFGGVGILATTVHLLVAFAVYHGLHVDPQASNLAGFMAAVGVSYLGNSRWTFGVSGPDQIYLPRFLALAGVGFLTSAGVTALVIAAGYPYVLALLAVGLTVPPMTYLGSKFLVFRDTAETEPPLAVPLGLAASALVWVAFAGTRINHDTAWYLVAARKWLDGATLYTDIIEVNPPLAFYLTLPALGLADVLGLSDADGMVAMMAILTGIATAWSVAILQAAWPRRQAVPMAATLALAATSGFGGYFGQREHILVLALMPWLSAMLCGERKGEVPRAAFAAVGICLKPFFLVYPLVITLVACVSRRSLRPVFSATNLVIGAMGAAYVAAAIWLHPEYFAEVVPNAKVTYGAYGFDAARILAEAHLPLALVALVALGLSGRDRGALVLVAWIVAALAAYAIQWTGFGYQAGPIFVLSVAGLGYVATRAEVPRVAMMLAAAGGVLAAGSVALSGRYENALAEQVAPRILAAKGPGAWLAVWSTEVAAGFPLALEARAEWVPNAPALWYLPGAMVGCDTALCTRLVEQTRAGMLHDLTEGCADVLIVDHQMLYLVEHGVTFEDVLGDDMRLRSALAQYERVTGNDRFEVLFRQDDAAMCG